MLNNIISVILGLLFGILVFNGLKNREVQTTEKVKWRIQINDKTILLDENLKPIE